MNILEAIRDPAIFKPFMGGDLRSWRGWLTACKVLYGLRPFTSFDRELIRQCTGRDPSKLPPQGFSTALFLVGRRSGKSRIASVIGAYEAGLAGHEARLSKGEKGLVICCAPTKQQAAVERAYLGALFEPELLRAEVIRETADGFDLSTGISIEIIQGDFKTVRNYTAVAVIVTEAAFFGLEEGARVKSDTELIRALKPGLATTGGKLIAISSPYAKRGWCYRTYQNNWANDKGPVLCWNCDSRTMNPTLPESVVTEAIAEDLQAAKTEWLGEFRDDIVAFCPREAVERLVVAGRRELFPRDGEKYRAFADLSGGRADDSVLAIAHKSRDGRVIIDRILRFVAPHSPQSAVDGMVEELRRYKCSSVMGDNFAAEWVQEAFHQRQIRYTKSPQPKSELYRNLLPLIFGEGALELLDEPVLVDQLAGLERRTRSGGKDQIDHAQGQKDDVANAVAGAAVICSRPVMYIGPF